MARQDEDSGTGTRSAALLTSPEVDPSERTFEADPGEVVRLQGRIVDEHGFPVAKAGKIRWGTHDPDQDTASMLSNASIIEPDGSFVIPLPAPWSEPVALFAYGVGFWSEIETVSPVLSTPEVQIPVKGLYGALWTLRDGAGNLPQSSPGLFTTAGFGVFVLLDDGVQGRTLRTHPDDRQRLAVMLGEMALRLQAGWTDTPHFRYGTFVEGAFGAPSLGRVYFHAALPGYAPLEEYIPLAPLDPDQPLRVLPLQEEANCWSVLTLEFDGPLVADPARNSSTLPIGSLRFRDTSNGTLLEWGVTCLEDPQIIDGIPCGTYEILLEDSRVYPKGHPVRQPILVTAQPGESHAIYDISGWGALRVTINGEVEGLPLMCRIMRYGSVFRHHMLTGQSTLIEPLPIGPAELWLSREIDGVSEYCTVASFDIAADVVTEITINM